MHRRTTGHRTARPVSADGFKTSTPTRSGTRRPTFDAGPLAQRMFHVRCRRREDDALMDAGTGALPSLPALVTLMRHIIPFATLMPMCSDPVPRRSPRYASIYLSISIHIYPYLSISIHIYPHLSIYVYIYPYLSISIHIYPYLP